MRQQHVFVVAAALTALLPVTASGQSVDIRPDNRYVGYPGSLVSWPSALPDLTACQDAEYYEPLDTHLLRYVDRVKVAGTRIQEYDTCRWMLTRNSWRWVLRPKGTVVAVDAMGRDLFDFGSPKGQKCGNPSPIGIPIIPAPSTVAFTPPPPPQLSSPPRVQPRAQVRAPLVTVTIPKLFLDEDGNKVENLPMGWALARFVGGTAQRSFDGTFDGHLIRFSEVPAGAVLVVSELPSSVPKGTRDSTRQLVLRIPVDAQGIWESGQEYVNILVDDDGFCGPLAWRCWVPAVVGGIIVWQMWPDDDEESRLSEPQPGAIDREPTKGGVRTPGGNPNPPNNPGGTPPLRIAFRF